MRRRFWLSRRSHDELLATSRRRFQDAAVANTHDGLDAASRGLCVFLCSRGYVSLRGEGRQYVGEVEGVDWTRADAAGRPSVLVETTEEYEARAAEQVPSGGTNPPRGRQDADAVVEDRQQREYEATRRLRILDMAASVAYAEILRGLNQNLLVDPADGTLSDEERQRVEDTVSSSVRRLLSSNATASFTVDRSVDFISTRTITGQLRISDPTATLRLEVRRPDMRSMPVAANTTLQPGQLIYATSDGTVTATPSRHLPIAGRLVSYSPGGSCVVALDGGGAVTMQVDAAATAADMAAELQRHGVDAVATSGNVVSTMFQIDADEDVRFVEAGAAFGQGLLSLTRQIGTAGSATYNVNGHSVEFPTSLTYSDNVAEFAGTLPWSHISVAAMGRRRATVSTL